MQVEAEEPDHDVAGWRRVATELASSFPHHAPRLEALAARLLPPLGSWDGPLVPSHGDYHPENVFLAPGFTTAIDHDHLGRREAAFDVGYAIAQLLIMSYFRTGRFSAGAHAARAFWRRYAHTGRAIWPRVRVHVARTFLQSLHYELCVLLRNPDNCVEVLDLWPDLVEQWLESDGPTTLEDLVRHR
jgi:aminoglycoside phosphotransferase (APT) family kinase protein